MPADDTPAGLDHAPRDQRGSDVPEPGPPPHELTAIGAPARRALTAAGLTTWDAVDAASDADLLALHGLGPRAARLLREARRSGRQ